MKKRKPANHSVRTRELLESMGAIVAPAESWSWQQVPDGEGGWTRIPRRVDTFGIGDKWALFEQMEVDHDVRDDQGCGMNVWCEKPNVALVQETSADGAGLRRKKIRESPFTPQLLDRGIRILLVLWDQKAPGCRWNSRIQQVEINSDGEVVFEECFMEVVG